MDAGHLLVYNMQLHIFYLISFLKTFRELSKEGIHISILHTGS